MSALDRVGSQSEFVDWCVGPLRWLLPHGALICGTGRLAGDGAAPLTVLNMDVPEEYVAAMCTPDGRYSTPIIRKWIGTREPQLFELEAAAPEAQSEWLGLFAESGLRNIAAHGVVDIAGNHASYFSFHRIPGRLGETQGTLLRLVVPYMHAKLIEITHAKDAIVSALQLTPRECEILAWVRDGKVNEDIAHILGVSFKTVKNHMANIMTKLDVGTRTQAAVKAIALGLIAPPRR